MRRFGARLRSPLRRARKRTSPALRPYSSTSAYSRPSAPAGPQTLGRGVVLFGTVWLGGDSEPLRGFVVIDRLGLVDYAGPFGPYPVPPLLPVLGGPNAWIGPGVVDTHVHLGFGDIDDCLRLGLVGVRDLGAPILAAQRWRTGRRGPVGSRPMTAVAGPIITAPGGYPSRSWGSDGYAAFASTPSEARQLVRQLAAGGADVIKVALEPGEVGWPVLEPVVLRAVVSAAHDAGLAAVAHALRTEMVIQAVDAGVDELAHTPTELLPESVVDAIAAHGISVVSTLQTFFGAGLGRAAAANAAALHRVGVVLRYGTDLGNAGTRPGVDPRELDRLADTGLGRLGALRAATQSAAAAPGLRGRSGLIEPGRAAALVVLSGDPVAEPGVWRSPVAVIADGRLLHNQP